jgi:hypothetical protein
MEHVKLIFLSLSLGFSMKGADLYNEHRKYFIFNKICREKRGVKNTISILLGILWGLITIYILATDSNIALFIVPLLISYIFRAKIDNINHGIATSIIILYLINPLNYSISFSNNYLEIISISIIVIIIGLYHDYRILISTREIGENEKDKVFYKKKVFYEFLHSLILYIGIPFGISLYFQNWNILIFSISFILAYEITRILSEKWVE